MEGEMELEEIAALAAKKELLVVTKIEPGTDGYADKAVPDFQNWHGFYPISEVDHWDTIINQHKTEDEAPKLPTDDGFMNIPDGVGEEQEF